MADGGGGDDLQSPTALAITGTAAILACAVTGHLICRHLSCYSQPVLQRYVIRIVLIVSVDALCTFVRRAQASLLPPPAVTGATLAAW